MLKTLINHVLMNLSKTELDQIIESLTYHNFTKQKS